MRIKYQGKSKRRVVGRYVWEQSNNYEQDVEEPDIVTDLLTAPTNEFVALEDPAKVEEVMEEFITGPVEEPVKLETLKPRRKKKSATGG